MSNALDDKLAGALALAISQRPRANLQQIARSAGISKATLNRIAPTRKAVIAMLMERATTHLQEALAKADLATPPFAEALGRLTANVMQGRVFFMFWNTAQWVEIMDDQEHAPMNFPSRLLWRGAGGVFPSRAKGRRVPYRPAGEMAGQSL